MEGKINCYLINKKINLLMSIRTLEERAQRLFSTKGQSSLDPSLMTKGSKGKASKEKELLRHKELATLEAQIYK